MDQFMQEAIREAREGAQEGGIPIGAALVDSEGNLVATGRNRRVQDRAVVMHAEINCLHNAGRTMNSIQGMTMYSTLMPCNMCAGAIVQFGITKVITAESENFAENNGLDLMLRNGVEIIDLDQAEAKELLRKFIERNPREWHGDIGQDPAKV
jgi:cytosine deaminase